MRITRRENPPRRTRDILAGGLVAGALDFVFAISLWGSRGVSAEIIPKSVASGILGPPAFEGGSAIVALGTGLHFSMTTTMAAAYALAPPTIHRRPLMAGPLYGAAIWFVMNKIVVPLSAAPMKPPPLTIQLADLAAHMLLVGLPIALLVRPSAQLVPASQHKIER